jgi:hypothetical protein
MKTSSRQLDVLSSHAQPDAVHPLGSRAKVLLSSVFGPYAQDDEYGSRALNPMELFHNQVTRTQGPFSLRMFHRSWGLMLIQSNIKAPCTLLDFPSLDRFVEELRDNQYDVVGISSIIPNVLKVRKMCELVRQYQPNATIVIGGHVANMPDLSERIDADLIVKGEGVSWFRRFLGEDASQPTRHPVSSSCSGARNAGVTLNDGPNDVAAVLIPSVGCPLGCNFCSTSAMFGGKGKFINFYQTGDELFEVMCGLEEELQTSSFFVMDENFLLQRPRALRLLELMEQHDKAWALSVFSSAKVLRSYTMDQLVGLGLTWVWMGLEGEDSQYKKLRNVDAFSLVRELQSHGIRVLGSTIIGLENHTPENIDEAIDHAVDYATDFHQFMLYTPIPGTPLHVETTAQGRMKDPSEYEDADIHGQSMFNFRHPHINDGQEGEFLTRAFDRDFAVNGPSIPRMVRTTLSGWRRHKNHPNPRIRRRFQWEARDLATTLTASVAGAKLYYRKDPLMRAKMNAILADLFREFGWKSRLTAAIGGRYVLRAMRREEKRLAAGWTYEPPTEYESNATVISAKAEPCRSVGARAGRAPFVPPAAESPSRQPVGVPAPLPAAV